MIALLFKIMFQDILLGLMKYVPDHFKRKEIYNEVIRNNPYALVHVLHHFKRQEMCDEAMRNNPPVLFLVPDRFKTE